MKNRFLSLKYLKGHAALGMLVDPEFCWSLDRFNREESLKLKQNFTFINRNFNMFPAAVNNKFKS